ncbi:MAG: prephenate dehydrogenase/arogenate dehydrogenase family protein [Antricoccus sp.]
MDIAQQPPTIAVIGLGLIGGSLALATHALGITTLGFARDQQTRKAAAEAGLRVTDSLDALLAGLDGNSIVVIATPLVAALELLPQIIAQTPDQVTVTDVVSVKSPLHEAALRSAAPHRFVGAHPMAGTTESGFGAAHIDLLQQARWAITLDESTDMQRAAAVFELAIAAGGTVTPLTSEQHDRSVAWISHIPHIIAETLAAGANWQPALGLGAGSFRDATRVASTRPELVEQMIGSNPFLAETLREYIDQLEHAHSALSNHGRLLPILQAGHLGRTTWEQRNTDSRATVTVEIDLRHQRAKAQLLQIGRAGGYLISCSTQLATALVFDPDAPLTGE